MIARLESRFPASSISTIRQHYILTALRNCWFIEGNWFFYWTRYMSVGELGWLDAITFGFGLLVEIPSGAIADFLGRKKTLAAGALLAASGITLMTLASASWYFWVGSFLLNTGWAFFSGADEAIVYDTLLENKQVKVYDQVLATTGIIARITAVFTILLGGWLYLLNIKLPNALWALAHIAAFFAAMGMKEPAIDTYKFNLKSYARQIIDGGRQLLRPVFQKYSLVAIALLSTYYLYDYSLIKPASAKSFGLLESEQAWLYAAFNIVGAAAVAFLPKLRKLVGEKRGFYALIIVMLTGLILSTFPLGLFGVAAMMLILISGTLSYPWASVLVNQEIPSRYRATTLSSLALITKLPHVLFAVMVGAMVENGQLSQFLWYMAFGLMVALALGFQVSSRVAKNPVFRSQR